VYPTQMRNRTTCGQMKREGLANTASASRRS
jgi:hypothetical protein